MRSTVEIEADRTGEMEEILSMSLESSGKITQRVGSDEEKVSVEIETESLGQLRGCTDTVFRLGTLSKKILER